MWTIGSLAYLVPLVLVGNAVLRGLSQFRRTELGTLPLGRNLSPHLQQVR